MKQKKLSTPIFLLLILLSMLLFAVILGVGGALLEHYLWFNYAIELNVERMIMIITVSVGIIIMALFVIRPLYIINFSHDTDKIDQVLRKSLKAHLKTSTEHYFNFLWYYVHKDLQSAEESINRVNKVLNKNAYLDGITSILLQEKRLEEAKVYIEKIKNKEVYHFKLAYIALVEKNLNKYQENTSKLTNPTLIEMLEINEAILGGEIEIAKGLLENIIKKTRGIRKYILVKLLEGLGT